MSSSQDDPSLLNKSDHHPKHDIKDHFYRFNFYALIKWVLVLSAALIGRQTATQKTTWAGKKANKLPLKKAFLLLVIATLLGMAELHSRKKFHKSMRKLHELEMEAETGVIENHP